MIEVGDFLVTLFFQCTEGDNYFFDVIILKGAERKNSGSACYNRSTKNVDFYPNYESEEFLKDEIKKAIRERFERKDKDKK